jgi:isochorismate synthase
VTVLGSPRLRAARAQAPGVRTGAGLASSIHHVVGEAAGAGAAAGLVAGSVAIESFDAVALYSAAVEAGLEAALWLRPSEHFALVGIGRAWSVEAAGPERFRDADAAWRSLVGNARLSRPVEVRGLGPVLLGGLGFTGRAPGSQGEWAPFGAASLVVPSLVALRSDRLSWLTGSVVADGGSASADVDELERIWAQLADRASELAPRAGEPVPKPPDAPLAIDGEWPAAEHWRHVVGLMAGAVGRGRLDKVVFARRVDMSSPAPLDVPSALRRLAASAPESTVFAFRRGTSTFMGATPERLVRAAGRTYRTAAIAGSIRRGSDPAEDSALAAELLASEKEREEHAVVVRAIRRQLAPISERIEIAPKPGILVLRHVQHLVTEVAGTLRVQEGLLALAGLLHPTPAVGGEPRDLALAMIDEHEGFDRGWYAGPVGWLSADGDGELMVALRCGLVDGSRVTLFAGCGIVADSDPDREWEESRIKMRAIAAALGRAGDEP